jgi:crotonobetainyl-CoA:carnitine CoA-transferase CaiB-like acyl-CoA transferase
MGDTVGALDGIVVADFSRVLAGPYATMLLADLGATVYKIERPDGGDETRTWGPPWAGGESTYFQAVNRNKHSISCDLSDPADRQAALALCERADVVVENFRTGTMARFGLGSADVLRRNPRAIYCSITGFGSGAGAELPGYDVLVQAVGGLMSVTGPAGGEPTKVGVAVVDVITGLHAMGGILAALRHRDLSGEGQYLEVNLLSCLLSGLVNQVSGYLNAGVVPRAMGNRHPSIAPYEVVPAADRLLVLAVGNDRQFGLLCSELGISPDPRFATNSGRVQHREALLSLLAAALAGASAQEWVSRLTARGVPCGLVNGIDEAVELADRLGLSPIVEVPGGGGVSKQVRHPVDFSATPATYRLPPPTWDDVRPITEVLREL